MRHLQTQREESRGGEEEERRGSQEAEDTIAQAREEQSKRQPRSLEVRESTCQCPRTKGQWLATARAKATGRRFHPASAARHSAASLCASSEWLRLSAPARARTACPGSPLLPSQQWNTIATTTATLAREPATASRSPGLVKLRRISSCG